MMFLQCIKQCACKTEIAFHELVIVFGTVHSSKVEYKVGFLTPGI